MYPSNIVAPIEPASSDAPTCHRRATRQPVIGKRCANLSSSSDTPIFRSGTMRPPVIVKRRADLSSSRDAPACHRQPTRQPVIVERRADLSSSTNTPTCHWRTMRQPVIASPAAGGTKQSRACGGIAASPWVACVRARRMLPRRAACAPCMGEWATARLSAASDGCILQPNGERSRSWGAMR